MRDQIYDWFREVTKANPDNRNPAAIAEEIMQRHFAHIYQMVNLCRELVQGMITEIVRKFLKQYSTEPNLASQDWDDLFRYFGITNLNEQVLLKKIQVQTVFVPSRNEFCNLYDPKDCSEIELDEAAEYLDKMAGEIHERAEYLRALAQYRRKNK